MDKEIQHKNDKVNLYFSKKKNNIHDAVSFQMPIFLAVFPA